MALEAPSRTRVAASEGIFGTLNGRGTQRDVANTLQLPQQVPRVGDILSCR